MDTKQLRQSLDQQIAAIQGRCEMIGFRAETMKMHADENMKHNGEQISADLRGIIDATLQIENLADEILGVQIGNYQTGNNKGVSMNKEGFIVELLKLADVLDSKGLAAEADEIDKIVQESSGAVWPGSPKPTSLEDTMYWQRRKEREKKMEEPPKVVPPVAPPAPPVA